MYRMARIDVGKASWVSALSVVCVLAMAPWAWSADVADLSTKVDALEKEVAALKQNGVSKDGVVTAGPTKGSFKLPGTNTSLTIGGFAKGTFIWTDKSAGAGSVGDQALIPATIAVGPTAGANEKSQITFHARQSQLFFRTVTPSDYGPVMTHIEMDFFGANGNEIATNSNGMRIRQAYGTIGNFAAGQFWTTAMFLIGFPETLDFGGPVATAEARQVGVRWTQPIGKVTSISIAAENPETLLATVGTPDDDRYPDFIGKLTTKIGNATVEGTGVLRFLHIDQPGVVDSATGWGMIFSGVIPTFGQDDIRFHGSYGEGFARYLGGLGTINDGVILANQIEMIKTTAGTVAYRHFWTPKVRTGVVVSQVKADNPAGSAGTLNKKVTSVHANLIWNPVPSVELGAEYIYGGREIESGLSGHINRVQLSARYNLF